MSKIIATPVWIDYGNGSNRFLIGADRELILSTDDATQHEMEEIKSAINGKAAAGMFMQELLDSVETLSSIADEHGSSTLADLFYLHSAILKGSSIDHYPGESKVLEIATSLPSGGQWLKAIHVDGQYVRHFVTARLKSGENGEPRQGVCTADDGTNVTLLGESGTVYECCHPVAIVPLGQLWGDTKEFAISQGVQETGNLPERTEQIAAFNQAPIRTDIEFGSAPGETGSLWTRAGEAENALAEKLKYLPEGTAAILADVVDEVWFLSIKDGKRVLVHALYKDGNVTEASSRFDFGLMWVDVEDGDILKYAEQVERATEAFQTVSVPISA